jgi:hypothetical protein
VVYIVSLLLAPVVSSLAFMVLLLNKEKLALMISNDAGKVTSRIMNI